MILVIDNYDSFTWNLVHYLMELGVEVRVERNDAMSAAEALASNAQGFLISPGPCTPTEAGISLDVRGLAANPAALRQRLIRLAVQGEFGVSLSRAQTLEVARLVTDWHGQGAVSLPGITVVRTGGALHFSATGAS